MRVFRYGGFIIAVLGAILSTWAEYQTQFSYFFMALNAFGSLLMIVGFILFIAGIEFKVNGERK